MSAVKKLLSSRRLFVFGTLISAAALSGFQLASIDTSVIYGDTLLSAMPTDECTSPGVDKTIIPQNETAFVIKKAAEIVHRSFNSSFLHLTSNCSTSNAIMMCCRQPFPHTPWWFQTMMRDFKWTSHWHAQSARTVTESGGDVSMCAMEKIGIKHWKELFCQFQNRSSGPGRSCHPKPPVSREASKFVFLRDPLERFLSAFIDKCERRPREGHCEPTIVFTDHQNKLTEKLLHNKKLLFEAYVDAMPLKWNLHFFPQR